MKQSIIRLAAVPMKGWTCTKWNINGNHIDTDLIDYTLTGATIATAVFERQSGSNIKNISTGETLEISPNPAETEITFNKPVTGNVSIYTETGNIVKQIYVYGSGMNISDIKSGSYIIIVDSDNEVLSGKFIKK